MRYLILWSVLGFCMGSVWSISAGEADEVPGNPKKTNSGLETGKWKAEEWGNEGKAEMVNAGVARALRLDFTGGDKEKVAFSQQVPVNADPQGEVRMHVYAPDKKPPQVAVYLLTGEKGEWHEAKPFTIKQGWNQLAVKLTSPNWKTAATKWAFKTGVDRADDLRGVGLIVMNGKKSGWVAVQGVSLDASVASKEVDALAKKMLSEDGEERAQAEKALAEVGRPAIPMLRKLKSHERPEVALRAGWALDKIEAKVEDQRRAAEAKRQEAKAFTEAKERAETLIQDLKGTRGKLQQLASAAREELLRARKTTKDLKAPSDDERKAYEDVLKQLDELSRETLRQVGTQQEQPVGGGQTAER